MPSIQVKALFILALLGGHEAVRIHENVNLTALAYESTGHLNPYNPGKAEKTYQEMNQECKSSWDRKCTQEGCEWKPFTLDGPWGSCRKSDKSLLASGPEAVKEHVKMFAGILKAKAKKYADSCSARFVNKLKCKRRIQQMVNAVRFMALARNKAGELSEEDHEEIKQAFEEARDSIAATVENGDSLKKLQDKILSSHAMEVNPLGTVKRMIETGVKLTEGSKEQQEEAKELIDGPDAFEPIEESDSIEKENEEAEETEETDDDFDESLRQMDLGSEDETDEIDDTLGTLGDDVDEEKPNSALQVRNSLQMDGSVIFAGSLLTVLVMGAIVLTLTIFPQFMAFGFIGALYYAFRLSKCLKEDNKAQKDGANETKKDQQVAKSNNRMTKWQAFKGTSKCVGKHILFPFKLIYKAGKWAYVAAFKKGNSTTSTTTKAPSKTTSPLE